MKLSMLLLALCFIHLTLAEISMSNLLTFW